MSYIYLDAYGRPYAVNSASSLATTATYVAAPSASAPYPTSNISSTVQPMQTTYTTQQPFYASAQPGSYASYARYKDAYSGLGSSSQPAAPPTSQYVASGLPAHSNGFEPFGQERKRVGTTGVRHASEQRRQKEAQYACSHPGCGATFTARHNLKFHEESHSGERTHYCQCGESFMRSTDLRRHQRNTCYLTTGYAR